VPTGLAGGKWCRAGFTLARFVRTGQRGTQ
jgi:hypothetical protein